MAMSVLTQSNPLSIAQTFGAPGSSRNAFISDRDARSLRLSPPVQVGADMNRCTVIIRGLPIAADEQYVRIMCTFAQDDILAVAMPASRADDKSATRIAAVQVNSRAAASEIANKLDGKNGLTVEIRQEAFSGPSGPSSPAVATTQSSMFDTASAFTDRASPPNIDYHGRNSYSHPEPFGASNMNAFMPNMSMGNSLGEPHARISGKSLINDPADEDDTGDIIDDPRAYAENVPSLLNQRRATLPQLSSMTARLGSLSLNTGAGVSTTQHGEANAFATPSAHSNVVSPGGMRVPMGNFQQSYPSMNGRTHNHAPPPANPADQNPPCNTLYVGNLPVEASEDELRRMFALQKGYKRMCFRMKNNGPMCFVEFEDIGSATRSLNDLYGVLLSSSKKGGIRLSFSKNPLGVRAHPTAGPGSGLSLGGGAQSYRTNGVGPPPGLGMPPGLVNRPSSYPISPVANGPGGMNGSTQNAHSLNSGLNSHAFGNGTSPLPYNGFVNGGAWGPHYVSSGTSGVSSPSNGHVNGSAHDPLMHGLLNGHASGSASAMGNSTSNGALNGSKNGGTISPPNGQINDHGRGAANTSANGMQFGTSHFSGGSSNHAFNSYSTRPVYQGFQPRHF
ncbi:hypothetical protein BD289DRAFT_449590 [Coniella lustricola]|uniref:RRM domain-containing protein n=1 Tax=Coniella lustricola TaxID=2025994 RepID=A0A2T3ALM0_9PEZI|nr:hypothetical protein BD289DRAFT_449590 [Coniella lustricola]